MKLMQAAKKILKMAEIETNRRKSLKMESQKYKKIKQQQ